MGKLVGTIKKLIPDYRTPTIVFGDQIPVTIPHSLLRELFNELDGTLEPHKILFEIDGKGEMKNFEVVKDAIRETREKNSTE